MTIEPRKMAEEDIALIYEECWMVTGSKTHPIIRLIQHIAYLQAELDTLKDAQPRVLPADYFTRLADYDNLKVCSVCGDKYTTASHGMCNSCYDQSIIDGF